jgi:hypothetical protein
LETFLFIEDLSEAETFEAIRGGSMVVVVRGFISYQDLFDSKRTIRFRYYWGPGQSGIPTMAGFPSNISWGQWITCGPAEDNKETEENPN